jgi:hypothetical protein
LSTAAAIDPSVVLEHAKMQHASDLAEYSAKSAAGLELFKSVIETAKVAIQSLIWINGGAAVALLAFIGHLATTPNVRVPIGSFALPLLCFVIGVWSAALFAASISLGQKLYSERWPRCANASVVASIIFGLSSPCLFWSGQFFLIRRVCRNVKDAPRPTNQRARLSRAVCSKPCKT